MNALAIQRKCMVELRAGGVQPDTLLLSNGSMTAGEFAFSHVLSQYKKRTVVEKYNNSSKPTKTGKRKQSTTTPSDTPETKKPKNQKNKT
jgi:hypothetical protein